MICYRRRGHNEADNPSFTQPLMYDLIDAKRSTRKLYTESLIGRGDITHGGGRAGAAGLPAASGAGLHRDPGGGQAADWTPARWCRPADHARSRSITTACPPRSPKRRSSGSWTPSSTCPTASPRTRGCSRSWPAGPPWSSRTRSTGRPASCSRSGRVLMDGHPVRLVGQDTRRGTFGQRHAVLVDRHTGEEYTPLRQFNSATRPVPRLRLAAVGVRGGGLRVRLLGRPARRAGLLGGPVRRLRQRRADHHGRVHQLRRAEVGPAVQRRAAAAARLRGPGPGPLLGPDRAVPRRCARRTT